jgi:HlyD family secretion protein
MDIVKTPTKKAFYKKYWYVIAALVSCIVLLLFARKYRDVTYVVLGDGLLLDTVAAGELVVSVRGYGQLVSKEVYRIGAETDGRLGAILVGAGDRVSKGQALVELDNPRLLQQLKDAELEFDADKADAVANNLSLESQVISWKAEVESADIDYMNAKMELDANNELIARGVDIVSRLDLERSQRAVQKHRQRLDVQKQRAVKYEESLVAIRAAEQARLRISENSLEQIRYRVQSLVVRASSDGIVQEMELALGQSIGQGDTITTIAKPDELRAEVRVQELRISEIRLGMKTAVDTRSNVISGTVTRIDPKVVDGSVLVEITLTGELPPEVRPDLNIEASIEVARLEDAIYVKRPVFARPSAQASIYKLNTGGDIAERVVVHYGQASTNYIEILGGLDVGDTVIISDPTSFEKHNKISIQ